MLRTSGLSQLLVDSNQISSDGQIELGVVSNLVETTPRVPIKIPASLLLGSTYFLRTYEESQSMLVENEARNALPRRSSVDETSLLQGQF
ncbi:MAG: hypothetical protein OXF08_10935 [Bacteroidetes bacterium]|nr:hypothetical protein [Bacteroidota bacterium]